MATRDRRSPQDLSLVGVTQLHSAAKSRFSNRYLQPFHDVHPCLLVLGPSTTGVSRRVRRRHRSEKPFLCHRLMARQIQKTQSP
jgi:hypothetical protein